MSGGSEAAVQAARDATRAAAERRCHRGLAEAAAALAGSDPERVCATFAAWQEAGERPLPWLPGPCLRALEPLGVTPPQDDDAVVLGRLLVGLQTDPAPVEAAATTVRRRSREGVALVGGLEVELAARSLVARVTDAWREIAQACAEIREHIDSGAARGDLGGVLATARARASESAEAITTELASVERALDSAAAARSHMDATTVLAPIPPVQPQSTPEPASPPQRATEPEPSPRAESGSEQEPEPEPAPELEAAPGGPAHEPDPAAREGGTGSPADDIGAAGRAAASAGAGSATAGPGAAWAAGAGAAAIAAGAAAPGSARPARPLPERRQRSPHLPMMDAGPVTPPPSGISAARAGAPIAAPVHGPPTPSALQPGVGEDTGPLDLAERPPPDSPPGAAGERGSVAEQTGPLPAADRPQPSPPPSARPASSGSRAPRPDPRPQPRQRPPAAAPSPRPGQMRSGGARSPGPPPGQARPPRPQGKLEKPRRRERQVSWLPFVFLVVAAGLAAWQLMGALGFGG